MDLQNSWVEMSTKRQDDNTLKHPSDASDDVDRTSSLPDEEPGRSPRNSHATWWGGGCTRIRCGGPYASRSSQASGVGGGQETVGGVEEAKGERTNHQEID